MATGGPRPPSSQRGVPVLLRFRAAWTAAPLAVSVALALELALAAASTAFAPKTTATAVALISLASIITLVVALGARNERALLASVLTLAGTCAFADLPIHRSGAAAFASIAGAAVLVFVEAAGAALEPKGGGARLSRPGSRHALWVGLVAVGGASAGWLLLSLQPDVSDLGLGALGVGVGAAVCLIALAALLATATIAEGKRD